MEEGLKLSIEEQTDLARLVSSPQYKVVNKIFEDELRKLEAQAIYNVDEEVDDRVLANRARMAKAAAAYYTNVRKRIEGEAQVPDLEVVNEPFVDITADFLASGV
jgi:hypothetical protein